MNEFAGQKFPGEFTYQVVEPNKSIKINLEDFFWKDFIKIFEELNKTKLIYKGTNKGENGNTKMSCSLMCHHQFKAGEKKYTVDSININSQARKKKIGCPFEIKICIEKSFPGILNLVFVDNSHSHQIIAHALTFIKIGNETIEKINTLFENSHSPASARHEIEKKAQLQDLADRSIYPRPQDYYRLYYKWLNGKYGEENGENMFLKLRENIENYQNGKIFYNGIYY